MSLAHVAAAIIARVGQGIVFAPAEGEAKPLDAVVSDYGFGLPPSGWDSEFFEGMGRYAEFKIPYDKLSEEPQYRETVTFAGREYEVRAARPLPEVGPDKLWWQLCGVADQRGAF